jgi:hypothetical protein
MVIHPVACIVQSVTTLQIVGGCWYICRLRYSRPHFYSYPLMPIMMGIGVLHHEAGMELKGEDKHGVYVKQTGNLLKNI